MNDEQRGSFIEQSRRAAAERRSLRQARLAGGIGTPITLHSENIPADTRRAPLRLEPEVVALYNALSEGTKARNSLEDLGVSNRLRTPAQINQTEDLIAAATLLARAEDSNLGAEIRARGGSSADVADLLLSVGPDSLRDDVMGVLGRSPRNATEAELEAAFGQAVTDERDFRSDPNPEPRAASGPSRPRPRYSSDEQAFRDSKAMRGYPGRGLDTLTGALQEGYALDRDIERSRSFDDQRAAKLGDVDQGRAAADQAVRDAAALRAGNGYMPLPLPLRTEAEAVAARTGLAQVPTQGESWYVQQQTPQGELTLAEERAILSAEDVRAQEAPAQELARRARPEDLRVIGLMGDAMRVNEGRSAPSQGATTLDEIAEVVTDPRQRVERGDRTGAIPQVNISEAQARTRQGLRRGGTTAQVRNVVELADAIVAAGGGDLLDRPLRGANPDERVRANAVAKRLGVSTGELDQLLNGLAQSHLAQTRQSSINPDTRDVVRRESAVTTNTSPKAQRRRQATLRYEAENPNQSRTLDSVSGANVSINAEGKRRANRGGTDRGASNVESRDLTYVGGTAFGERLKAARSRKEGRISQEAADPTIGALRPEYRAKGGGFVERERSPHYLQTQGGKRIKKPGQMPAYSQKGKGQQYNDAQIAQEYARRDAATKRAAFEQAIRERTNNAVTVSNVPAPDNTLNAPGPSAPTTTQLQVEEQRRPTAVEHDLRQRLLGVFR